MIFFRVILCVLLFTTTSLYSQIPNELQNTIWEQEGYDRILKIKDSSYSYLNADAYTCSVLAKGDFNGRFEIIGFKNDQLILNPGGIVNYRFKKINSSPEICSQENNRNASFEINFKAFWETFRNNYAFFEKRNIEWDKIYKKYLPIIEKLKSEKEFALVLQEIVEKFEDGHIRLEIPDSILSSRTSTNKEVAISKKKLLSDITSNYLKTSKSYNNGVLRWGVLKDSNVGYIAITDMNNFANYVPNELKNNDKFDSIFDEKRNQAQPLDYFKDEVKGANQIMMKVMNDLSHTKSLIVDLRFNGGGFETVALELLSHFTNEKKEIISIKAKTKNGFTPIQNYALNPASKNTKKVYLLISPYTASAAEIFTLGSLAYQNFERYGSRSAGIFSEILWKELPIGWGYSLSNEIYLDYKNRSYEGKGILADHELNYPRNRAEFYQNFYHDNNFSDSAIEKIIESHTNN